MSRSTGVVVLSLAIGLTGASWGYLQQTRTRAALTSQDYVEIQQLYSSYAKAADLANGQAYAATFTPDGEFVSARAAGQGNWIRTTVRGTDALIKTGSTGGLRHNFINLNVTLTPDGADATCYLLLYNVRNVPATLIMTATYQDTLIRNPQGWRFKRRIIWGDDDPMSPFRPPSLPFGRP